MNPLTVVNVIASGILTAGVSAFMILLYRSDGVVRRWPLTGSIILRASLTATAAGALFNCLTMSTPQFSEIMMNCGLAGIFSWAVYFHTKLIKKDIHGPNPQHQPRNDEGNTRQDSRTERPNP
jgi:hypothetical protein